MKTGQLKGSFAPGVTCGFAAACIFYVAAWVTHLPALDLQARVAGPAILISWLLGALALGRSVARGQAALAGLVAGVTTSLLILIPLGSALVETPEGDAPLPGTSGLATSAVVRAGGFMAVAIVVGFIGTFVGSRLSDAPARTGRAWLPRFAAVACVATVPLIAIGGIVTTTDAGMAFPDWPTSDGANMFLYPLSLMARPDRYFEHTHRLFGAFVGLTVLSLALFTFATERARGFRIAAAILFVAVCVQGLMGAVRVTEDSMSLRFVHGFAAQVFFGCLVGFAVAVSGAWAPVGTLPRDPLLRRLKLFSTMALHSCLLQHLLGAMYRHMKYGGSKGVSHILYTHAALAFVVFVASIIAVIIGSSAAGVAGPLGRPIKRWTTILGATVSIQFLLGWGAFFAVMHDKGVLTNPAVATATITTAHQANGALLLGSLVVVWLLSRRAWKATSCPEPSA
ncbi:MAG: COX15/CtaA family protein [Phycisphaeraceae bacterium]|nr:COX15/CtaA family protein [Phycisphaeraceae bacterium]MCW5767361.1 COX15/CtaA family protein [Phycisphaeraceae bacterium]